MDSKVPLLSQHMKLFSSSINYFEVADLLLYGCIPNAPKPYCTLLMSTTTFHITTKPSHHLKLLFFSGSQIFRPQLEGFCDNFRIIQAIP